MAELKRGETLRAICERGAEELDDPKAVRRLEEDVKGWRRQDEDFDLRYRGLQRRPGGPGRAPIFTEAAQEAFFEEMESSGGRFQEAVARTRERDFEVSPNHIYAKLNPNVGSFDAAFAERFHRLESDRYHHVRERAFEEALDPKSKASARMIEFLLKTGLPHLHSERQIVEHQGKVEHRHLHSVDREALAAFEERASKLWAGREERLLLGEPVYEGEVEEAPA